jgi:hypothetical protein
MGYHLYMANTYSDFKVGQIVEHIASGKLYLVCDDQMNYRGRLQVIGQRDGRDFGPVRFIDATKLRVLVAR